MNSGSLCHDVDFEPYRVAAGDYLWVHANQIQQWGSLAGVTGLAVLFRSEILTPAAIEHLHHSQVWFRTVYRHEEIPQHAAALVQILRDTENSDDSTPNLSAERILESLLLQLPAAAHANTGLRGLSVYEQFVSLLDVDGSVQRSVQHFATLMDCSAKKINEAVKERSGRTVKQAIDERLVLEAKRHLAYRPDLPIRAVAETLGFDDTANFAKFFKRLEHQTPGSWRASFTGETD
ncbi:helix-turn-helix domain-containing protein [Glutamicibacter sp. NPDC087344]|uniref:AraC family transcriptional regulator n=1 Tax=Glutamicibacter sp. NPDC087344 TaxID=3363994 RepID=UPI00382645F9